MFDSLPKQYDGVPWSPHGNDFLRAKWIKVDTKSSVSNFDLEWSGVLCRESFLND